MVLWFWDKLANVVNRLVAILILLVPQYSYNNSIEVQACQKLSKTGLQYIHFIQINQKKIKFQINFELFAKSLIFALLFHTGCSAVR